MRLLVFVLFFSFLFIASSMQASAMTRHESKATLCYCQDCQRVKSHPCIDAEKEISAAFLSTSLATINGTHENPKPILALVCQYIGHLKKWLPMETSTHISSVHLSPCVHYHMDEIPRVSSMIYTYPIIPENVAFKTKFGCYFGEDNKIRRHKCFPKAGDSKVVAKRFKTTSDCGNYKIIMKKSKVFESPYHTRKISAFQVTLQYGLDLLPRIREAINQQ